LWEEPLGLVAVEAAMRGTAVAASHYGGFRETVLDGQTGLLVAPGDEFALSEALHSLLMNRDKTEVMGMAGRDHALANFSLNRMIEQYEQAYHDLLA
jgi:glycosyltransferase involved in cell wall biosynthesis